jgi:signal transduction histidine kinase
VISLLGHQFEKEGVIVKTSFEPDLPKIFADGEKLKQVLVNLMVNAKQAISGNGTIVVTAKVDQEQQGILISVSDNGCGMSPKTAEKIFDPFFTTKENGTGLGLAIVKKFIDLHAGIITVESEVKKGTAFKIFIPRPKD